MSLKTEVSLKVGFLPNTVGKQPSDHALIRASCTDARHLILVWFWGRGCKLVMNTLKFCKHTCRHFSVVISSCNKTTPSRPCCFIGTKSTPKKDYIIFWYLRSHHQNLLQTSVWPVFACMDTWHLTLICDESQMPNGDHDHNHHHHHPLDILFLCNELYDSSPSVLAANFV